MTRLARTKTARPRRKTAELERTVAQVRDRYAKIARGEISGCCGTGGASAAQPATGCAAPGGRPETDVAHGIGYADRDLALLPEGANLGLGCGAPIGFLDLRPGETVLDLGSGAGVDALLAARAVGPKGRVIGVDMTPEMIARGRANAASASFAHAEFREGRLEALPIEDASVDAVTSNCVINLVPDKAAVFREIARVLRPGGRLVISDILLDGRFPEVVERDMLAYVGCVSGALQRAAYFSLVEEAGLSDVRALKDVDYLAAAGYDALPPELVQRMRAEGTPPEVLAGKVRSVTFRATKPAEPSRRG